MESFGEAEVLIESTIVGKVRVQHLSALDALRPRIGLRVGVDLNPISGSLYSGQEPPKQYWLTDLGGDLRISEKGPSIGILQWVGPHREVRALPYPSESQIQLACDVDPWTLERLEMLRGGQDLALWVDLWPRLEHREGYLSASIRGFRLAAPRVDWLRFLEEVGYGRYEFLELRIPEASTEIAHRAIGGIREAQRRLWAGDHAAALAECRKAIEALEDLSPGRRLEALLAKSLHPERARAYASIASRVKEIASVAVHDYGRDATFSRAEIGSLIRMVASLASIALDAARGESER
jgi:hypothetical protein